ncbi:MAG: integrase/recombinase [Frankiales bacterium]|nr:integrase/recombinase [Frankiales bacterium]
MPTVRSAAVYARISSDQDGTALGVTRQLEDCRKLARDRGWTIGDEYVDNDVSAYKDRRRPQYERMVADVHDGLRDAVIVYNLDRLTRRPKELEEFVDVCAAAGVRELATVTADIDLGNDDGLFMARIFAAFAAKESGRRSARVRRKMEANAAAGLPHGGFQRPFGYDDDKITIRPDEATILRILTERVLAGESLRSLTTWMDTEGIRTINGKLWRTGTLRDQLMNPRLAGLRTHRGQVVGNAVWEPIISEEDHRRLLALFQQRAANGKRAPRSYALSGLLRCGRCGGTLYSSRRETTRRYVCLSGPDHRGCGGITVTADPVERLIADAVLYRLDSPDLADTLAGRTAADERLAGLAEQLADDRSQLDELATLHGERQFSTREWLAARQPVEQRITTAEQLLARLNRDDALQRLVGTGDALRAQWETLALQRQHAVIRTILDHAVITPGTAGAQRLDPDRVHPVWRL